MVFDEQSPDDAKSEALKFIVHLIGDLHQPLHVGFADDAGELSIGLSKPDETNLHNVWNFNFLRGRVVANDFLDS